MIAIPICQMLELQVLGWELVLDCEETVILGSSLCSLLLLSRGMSLDVGERAGWTWILNLFFGVCAA